MTQPSSVRDRAAALCGMERGDVKRDSIDSAHQYTSADGRPFPNLTTSLKIGAHPAQSDTLLLEKQQAFDRMKIQERIVHPAGSSAFGKFTVTHDVSKLTKAKLFQPGTVTPCYTRFSTVTLGREYPDSARNPRGFATKFYTPDGNYDMVGLNWPIFFVRDPWLGTDNIRSQQRNPANFLLDFQAWFDFLANVPEAMHAGTMLLSDHGTPKGWRYMNGFGCHTFSWVNEEGQRTFIKYHWLSQQGTKNLTMEEATKMCGQDPDYAKRDLWQHIEKGGKCEWQLNVQTMTEDEANSTDFDPFDVTKIWPRGEFPMQPVGTLTLDKNPENYFRDVEQAAFSPGSLVPGIEASPDSLLLWRMFFYRDAQYHRLGVNLHQIPVNCPFMADNINSDNVDGAMRVDANNKGKQPYMPSLINAKQSIAIESKSQEQPLSITSNKNEESSLQLARNTNNFRHRGQESEYDQVRELWTRVMSDQEKQNTANNASFLLNTVGDFDVITLFLSQCYAISPDYAEKIHERLTMKEQIQMENVKEKAKIAHLVNVDQNHLVGIAKETSFMGMKKIECPYKFK